VTVGAAHRELCSQHHLAQALIVFFRHKAHPEEKWQHEPRDETRPRPGRINQEVHARQKSDTGNHKEGNQWHAKDRWRPRCAFVDRLHGNSLVHIDQPKNQPAMTPAAPAIAAPMKMLLMSMKRAPAKAIL